MHENGRTLSKFGRRGEERGVGGCRRENEVRQKERSDFDCHGRSEGCRCCGSGDGRVR